MKKILSMVLVILTVAATAFVFSGCNNESDKTDDDISTTEAVFGDFVATDLDGNTVTQEIFAQNKLTMVNIWATFCGPCINEMPELGELAEEYAEKGVAIVGIPVDVADGSGRIDEKLHSKATDIVSQTKADYVHIVPTADMIKRKLSSVYSVPETIFVDSQGNQIGESYVGARSKDKWEVIINELLGEIQ